MPVHGQQIHSYYLIVNFNNMAKQAGILQIVGTIGQLTFYYDTIDGVYRVKGKTHLDAERIRTDDSFIRTRENAKEFGLAAKAGHLMRESITSILAKAKDRRVTSRLVKDLMKVSHTDTTSARGERTPAAGDLTLLSGFNFNKNAVFNSTFEAPSTVTVDRVAGTIDIGILSFVPIDSMAAPQGATHFKIVMAGSEVDFDAVTYNTDLQTTAILPFDSTATTSISQSLSVSAGTVLPLFAYIGIQWYEQVNGNYYILNNHRNNCLAVVKVDQV
jgi:hypothetical protein